MNNCEYNTAFEMLKWFYGIENEPVTENLQNLYSFDQTKYCSFGQCHAMSFDETGYIYIPEDCSSGSCNLFIALHGCQMAYQDIGLSFIKNSGLIQVAEANKIVILFPQLTKSTIPYNPYSCWDWWGYTSPLYATKQAPQIKAIEKMFIDLT